MKHEILLSLAAFAILVAPVHAQTSADSTAIRQAALDYIEGWYTGDAERMERAVHPELAKRLVFTDADSGLSFLNQQSAMTLVHNTAEGIGKEVPQDRRLKEVTILDIYENAASVRITASDWVDYLHVAKWNGEWKIVNVLYELTPQE